MNRRMGLFLIVALLTGAAAGQSKPSSIAAHPEVAAALQVLDYWVQARMADREQPGLSVGIVHDQELIWAKGYGFADLERKVPADSRTLYRIASISKLFTSTAVLQLRDAGQLQLDDPVSQYLPWFRIGAAGADAPPITIRQLLTHSAGLPREARGVHWAKLHFPGRDEMISALPEQECVFPPDYEWKYSNLGLSLAGEVVAQVSGVSWDRYLYEKILSPLGMSATVPLPRPDQPGLATGYTHRVPGHERAIEPFVDIAAERAAGNMASNVEDLARFLALQFREGAAGGSNVLSGHTLRDMHRVHWLFPDWNGGWGLGFAVQRKGSETMVGHGGSLPGHRTQIGFSPKDKLGVIVLTNANDGDPGAYLDRAMKLLLPALREAVPGPQPSPLQPGWEKYTGTYSWRHDEARVEVLAGRLTIVFPLAEDPWATRVVLEPIGDHRFRTAPQTFSYSLNGEVVRFEVDTQGRVTGMGTENFHWVRQD